MIHDAAVFVLLIEWFNEVGPEMVSYGIVLISDSLKCNTMSYKIY
jgi:hypothetical protein